MSNLPKFVTFREEGPREGFQIEPRLYPLAERAALVDALSETELKRIQVASFVSPRAVPAMADAAELFATIKRKPGVSYSALWLNENGFRRAAATPGVDLEGMIMFYTSEAFCQSNNNCSATEMRDRQRDWVELYRAHGLALETAYIVTAFGCNFQGPIALETVTDLVRWIVELCAELAIPLPKIYLADTVGWANPEAIKRRMGAVREMAPEARLGLHLHDTRGLGGANVYAALEMGIDLFESSVAGLGGCPFSGHKDSQAAGNICTEDMVFLCHELGIATGIDLEKLIEAARLAERIIGRPLSGKLMHSGSLGHYR
jgi:isopropylmalate/homocitrate/citramalate synthase